MIDEGNQDATLDTNEVRSHVEQTPHPKRAVAFPHYQIAFPKEDPALAKTDEAIRLEQMLGDFNLIKDYIVRKKNALKIHPTLDESGKSMLQEEILDQEALTAIIDDRLLSFEEKSRLVGHESQESDQAVERIRNRMQSFPEAHADSKIDKDIPPDVTIELTDSILEAMADGTVSNFIKKVQAMRKKEESDRKLKELQGEKPHEGSLLPDLQMKVRIGVENNQLVVRLDDNGFPFPAEDIDDPRGFIGKRDRKTNGYLEDRDIETKGIGNALIQEMLEHYDDAHPSFRPVAVEHGARIEFRMDLSEPPASIPQ